MAAKRSSGSIEARMSSDTMPMSAWKKRIARGM